MSVEFNSNPYRDILIFSGVELDPEKQLERSPLQGDALDEAKREIKASYDSYKKSLTMEYKQFLKIVSENREKIESTGMPAEARALVATKLDEMSDERIKGKEKTFWKITRLIYRIGRLLRGYGCCCLSKPEWGTGFRTKGEWGAELASRIRSVDKDMLQRQIKDCVSHKTGYGFLETPPYQIMGSLEGQINEMPDEDFKDVLNNIVFEYQQDDFIMSAKSNVKYVFYGNLNETKKQIFYEELLSGEGWFARTWDIIKSGLTEVQIEAFVTDEMVEKSGDPQIVRPEVHVESFDIFYSILMGKKIQKLLEKGKYLPISALLVKVSKEMEVSIMTRLTNKERVQLMANIKLEELNSQRRRWR